MKHESSFLSVITVGSPSLLFWITDDRSCSGAGLLDAKTASFALHVGYKLVTSNVSYGTGETGFHHDVSYPLSVYPSTVAVVGFRASG
jgi:hypothetical protein